MKWYKVLGNFLAILFSILYSITLVSIIVLFFFTSFFKGDIYTSILKSIDLKEIKLSDIDPRFKELFGKDVTIEEAFVLTLEEVGIDSNVALEIINNEEVKEVVGEFIGDCVNYTVNQDKLPEIKEEDIDKILDNIDIDKIENKEINKEEIMEYVDEINISAKDYLMEGFNYANNYNN